MSGVLQQLFLGLMYLMVRFKPAFSFSALDSQQEPRSRS